VSRTSTLPRRLQPMLATLTDVPFEDAGWVFEDKYEIESGKVTLYSRNGKIISHSYGEVAKALEGVKDDAVIDGELVALDTNGVPRFQLLQNALRNEAKLQYCAFDLMFHENEDLRGLPLLERKKRLRGILPRHKLIAFSRHRKTFGTKYFEEAERKGLEGIMAKRAESTYVSGSRSADRLKSRPRNGRKSSLPDLRPQTNATVFWSIAVREKNVWRYIGHVGTGFSHKTLEELHGKLIKLKSSKSPFSASVKDEAVTTWVKPLLVAEVKFTEWTSSGEMLHPVYLGLRTDKRANDVQREREKPRRVRAPRPFPVEF
jgi:bifunctional non-homologous end joining protein LigD